MSEMAFRLPDRGRIDRTRKLSFKFNGQSFTGYPGDTLASALLANGVSIVGRSFKYHRPRGIMSAGIEETNAIVQQLGEEEEPNIAATMLPLSDNLEAQSVSSWPSVNVDIRAIGSLFHRFIPAGFY